MVLRLATSVFQVDRMFTKSKEKVLLSTKKSTILFRFVTTSMIGDKVGYCYLLRLGY